MPPTDVKPYVKRGKHDQADAEAIAEAVARPSMRFVAVKSVDQQAVLMLHRTRALLMRQRAMLAKALRGHLSEFGIVVAKGIRNVQKLSAIVGDHDDHRLPDVARAALALMIEQPRDTTQKGADRPSWDSWRRRSQPLQIRPAACRLAWPDAEGAVEPRQSLSGKHQQVRRRLCSPPAGSWRPGCGQRAQAKKAPDGSAWLDRLLARRHINVATMAKGAVYQARA